MMHIKANYRLADETEHHIILQDIGPHDHYQTITNAAEWVVEQMVPRLKGRKLYYVDTDDQVDQILIHDGRFAGFATGGPNPSIDEPVDLTGQTPITATRLPGVVYFSVMVDRPRAEYLLKCLDEPLCKHCGREVAECEADPCAAAQHAYDSFVDAIEYRGADYGKD